MAPGKHERIDDIKQALCEAKTLNMSAADIVGSGGQQGFSETYRGVQMAVNLIKKVRMQNGVNHAYAQPAIVAITRGARAGQIIGGMLLAPPAEQAPRIRDGQGGGPAMGQGAGGGSGLPYGRTTRARTHYAVGQSHLTHMSQIIFSRNSS